MALPKKFQATERVRRKAAGLRNSYSNPEQAITIYNEGVNGPRTLRAIRYS